MAVCVIGMDLGGTNIKAAAVNEQGKILAKETRPTMGDRGASWILDQMAEMARAVAARVGCSWREVAGVGVGIPGFLDFSQGVAEEVVNLGWKNVSVAREMEERLQVPVALDNDANAAAIGEAWVGAGRGYRHILAVTIGTGIGGGLIVDGQIYHGANGMAGELGHMVIEPGGELCNCGHRGCLERIASASAVLRAAKKRLAAGEPSSLVPLANLSTKDVFDHARAGDALACSVVDHMAERLGYGLALAANLLNPEMLVIGGGVSAAWDVLFPPLNASFSAYALERVRQAALIRPAELGNDAGVLGCARLAWLAVQ